MKWLLITGEIPGNPGDAWARFGVERLIASVDQPPQFVLLDKGSDEMMVPQPFDFAVLCGMPLMWSYPSGDCHLNFPWWKALTGWLSEGRRLILAGFGLYFVYRRWLDDFGVADRNYVAAETHHLIERCCLAYSRNPLVDELFGPGDIPFSACPSVLASSHRGHRWRKLCNFVPGGTHYPSTCIRESAAWDRKLYAIARTLIQAGYTFVAHSLGDERLATWLGFPPSQLRRWDGNPKALLRYYAQCSKYFGNRAHGAIISRSFGADVLWCGAETRAEAIRLVGGKTASLSAITPNDVAAWAYDWPCNADFDRETVLNQQVEMFRRAIYGRLDPH